NPNTNNPNRLFFILVLSSSVAALFESPEIVLAARAIVQRAVPLSKPGTPRKSGEGETAVNQIANTFDTNICGRVLRNRFLIQSVMPLPRKYGGHAVLPDSFYGIQ